MASSSNAGTAAKQGLLRPLDEKTEKWALRRRITRGTLERLGVGSGTVKFPELNGYFEAIIFRYSSSTWKARSLDKKGFVSKAGMQVSFWGLEDVLKGIERDPEAPIYIVEGEMDRCALVECGIDRSQVLSAPGASGKEDAELEYVKRALDAGLKKAKKIVLCTDNDTAGTILRKALVRVIGVAKCWFVDWPGEVEVDNEKPKPGVKDANDCLVQYGMDAVLDLIEKPKEWPSYGLYRIDQVPREPDLTRWVIGRDQGSLAEMNQKIWFGAPCLSVVTGHPGHGKTQMMAQIWQQIAYNYDLVVAVATFETRPRPHYQKILRQLHSRKRLEDMSDDELISADRWIRDHYLFMQHPEQRPTLAWLLEQSFYAISRYNAKVILVDPWNRLESQRESRETETEYIGNCLRDINIFTRDLGVHFQILAHPSKSDNRDRGGRMPVLEDIAGSKHWDNMVDQGFAVWRPRTYNESGDRVTYAEFHHLKARFSQLGYPTKFGLEFDTDFERYRVVPLQQPQAKKKRQQADDE